MNIIHFFREMIFPGGCGICGNMLITSEEAYFGLCMKCLEKLNCSVDTRCSVCGKPLISEIDICMYCRKSKDDQQKLLDSTMALYPYAGIYKNLLSAYKFKQNKQLSHFLLSKLMEIGSDIETKINDSLTWVPVPPRHGKIKQSGWDQIDYLAGKMNQQKNISVSRCLTRLNTKAQKTLNRNERLSNLKGQIICSKKAPRKAIIFDDVITTGATVEACAEALKKAGTEQVFAICLFYD